MVSSGAATPEAYLAELPEDRLASVAAVRDVINANLPDGVVETMAYGMIGWVVDLAVSGPTESGRPIMVAALAAQKQKISLYLTALYTDPEASAAFEAAWKVAVGSIDRGKSCVRFRDLEHAAVDVIARSIADLDIEDLIGRVDAPS